jgi:hypothetical protein
VLPSQVCSSAADGGSTVHRPSTGRERQCRAIHPFTKEVRSYGDTVQEERDQNKELLELSKQTLALTKEVHSLGGAATDGG